MIKIYIDFMEAVKGNIQLHLYKNGKEIMILRDFLDINYLKESERLKAVAKLAKELEIVANLNYGGRKA